ncbi:IclR family transcriptional regulator [Arthrobacter sp. MYb211]|uniref:IclR family transcriptional regulator n=1 Tax=Micrococcaceae TaxID=1268 RepID=UPI000CFD0E1B|nr:MULTISPECIES: IclR family transcriptional regulator [unclassified Arthrobacter]PQZ97552.1 IclR family transcriptional regulator [Arthrobacter sp. MYb224]PRA04217.1 IclR family transcriptional regulator [Arthrobacter sp. MYb229]PRA11586.1 IclR family transcriptional regulator [Arthrobacter sp. MYb221]PRB51871.1 IclR family transcriptional regulator [Arthrobacter sp. MYb216]PRC07911.1 IclR family transcriptional regulator [Arthrobacter sp. MYb211]
MTQTASKSTTGGVQSVERAFELLEVIARAGGEAALSELAADTPLPLPTIHRLLRTLVGVGYVRQLPNRRYSLGPRLIRLGEVANRQLGALASPVLKELVGKLGESANIAVLDGDMVTYIAQAQSPHSMRMITEVGRRAMLHNSGVGKAVLSVLDDERVQRLVAQAGMPPKTANTITTLGKLFTDVEATRERGYAIDEEEQELGVRCIAVPVPGAPTPMAISVSGPVTRVDEAFIKSAVPELQEAARELGRQLVAVAE